MRRKPHHVAMGALIGTFLIACAGSTRADTERHESADKEAMHDIASSDSPSSDAKKVVYPSVETFVQAWTVYDPVTCMTVDSGSHTIVTPP